MQRFLRLAALALACAWPCYHASAQSFSNTEIDRYYRGGAYAPFDSMPHTQRYSYHMNGSIFFPGYDARNLIMMDYLDRIDRAEKFGYCPPRDPFADPTVTPSGWRFGTGLRLFRRH